jgi:putative phage-type endonuclease
MMRRHQQMLTSVLECIQSNEMIPPVGDHSFALKQWNAELESILLEIYDDTEDQKAAGRIVDLVSDAYDLFLKEASNPQWHKSSVEERTALIQKLKTCPQIEQRTEAWYDHYAHVITASEFSTVLYMGRGAKRRDLVLSKAFPKKEDRSTYRLACPTAELSPMGWGIRFEPVVKQLLEYKDGLTICELGRITHSKTPTLAASPDGIIETSKNPCQIGRLVEIKCPYSRTIGGEIPFEYWVQMQVQMEVTDIDECEYVEAEIVSLKQAQPTVDLSGFALQGILYLLQKDEGQPHETMYIYGDIQSTRCPAFPSGYHLVETIPWGLKQWSRKVVQRDRGWYNATLPFQDAFWADVERVRNEGPTPKQTQCLIKDS